MGGAHQVAVGGGGAEGLERAQQRVAEDPPHLSVDWLLPGLLVEAAGSEQDVGLPLVRNRAPRHGHVIVELWEERGHR